MTEQTVVTQDEVIGFLGAYLEDQELPPAAITPASRLDELGLDSIHLAELLLLARGRLVEEGRLPADASITAMPHVETVADLTDVLRSLSV